MFRRGAAVLTLVCVAIACGVEIANIPDPPGGGSADGGNADGQPSTLDATAGGCPDVTWTTRFPTAMAHAVTVDAVGRVFAAGNDGKQAWVAELERCTGAIVRERRFAPDARNATAGAIAATDSEILVSGHAGNGGYEDEAGTFFRLAKDDFRELGRQLRPGRGWSDLNRMAVGPDGTVWLAGIVGIFGGSSNQNGWVVRPGDGGCQTFLGQSVGGLEILPDGHALVALQTDAGTTSLVELNRCNAGKLTAVPLPAVGAPNDLLRSGDDLYLIGAMGGSSAQDKGWVAGRRGDGGWTLAAAVDPNVGLDPMVRMTSDGDALFVAGSQNASLSTATPTVYRYALPLLTGAEPIWTGLAFGADLHAIGGLRAGPKGDDALFVAGWATGGRVGGALARCRKSTGCAN
jgi:hypothetical protein